MIKHQMVILLALFLKIMSKSLNVNTAGAGLPAVGDSQPSVFQMPTFDEHHMQAMVQTSNGLLAHVEQLSKDVRNREAQQDDAPSNAPVQQDRVDEEEHQEEVEEEQQHDQPKNTSKRKRKHVSSQQKNQEKRAAKKAKRAPYKAMADAHKNTKGKEVEETHSDDNGATSSPKNSHDDADDQKDVGLFSKPTPRVMKPEKAASEEEEEEGSAATAKVAPRPDVPANEGALEDDEGSDEVDAGVPSLASVPGEEEEALDEAQDNEGSSNDLSEDDDDSNFRIPKKRVSSEGTSDDEEIFDNDFMYDDEEVDTATHEVPTKAPALKRVSSKDAAQMLKDIFKNY